VGGGFCSFLGVYKIGLAWKGRISFHFSLMWDLLLSRRLEFVLSMLLKCRY
jgi:hypothetical protein